MVHCLSYPFWGVDHLYIIESCLWKALLVFLIQKDFSPFWLSVYPAPTMHGPKAVARSRTLNFRDQAQVLCCRWYQKRSCLAFLGWELGWLLLRVHFFFFFSAFNWGHTIRQGMHQIITEVQYDSTRLSLFWTLKANPMLFRYIPIPLPPPLSS